MRANVHEAIEADVAAFAVSLRRLRKARGWTQPRLGRLAGISPSTVCVLETGTNGPSLLTACALARALGTTVDAMTGTVAEVPCE